jgi:electron transfer flavoprotein alpha subunit
MVKLTVQLDGVAGRKLIGRSEAQKGQADLTSAPIIISGGRGLKQKENFQIIFELAQAIGGSVGASRPVVDAEWLPREYQIGSSGQTVSPNLYVAIGISGAIQHLVGMQTSRCIVAINKDAEAPIFKIAHYGIVDDLFKVVPALTKIFNDLKAAG